MKRVIAVLDLPPRRSLPNVRASFHAAAIRWNAEVIWITKPIPWKSVVDGDLELAKKFNIQAVPTKLLINSTGQHYKSNLSGIKLLDEIIDQLKLDPTKFSNLRDDLQKE